MRIGFVGSGRMAQAIAKGFITAGIVKARNIWASDTNKGMLKIIEDLHVNITRDNREVVQRSDVIILAVKPQVMLDVLKEIKPEFSADKLAISIAAGITVNFLQDNLNPASRVVRIMPNTPMLANAGASVYCPGSNAKPEDSRLVQALFSSVGTCDYLPEHLLDAVTGLSGSGPAYFCMAIDALADGGVKMGLPRDLSIKLAAQSALGAGKLVLESGKHPAELKDAVCSPGGTAIDAVYALEKGGMKAALINAVEVATLKSKKLGIK